MENKYLKKAADTLRTTQDIFKQYKSDVISMQNNMTHIENNKINLTDITSDYKSYLKNISNVLQNALESITLIGVAVQDLYNTINTEKK